MCGHDEPCPANTAFACAAPPACLADDRFNLDHTSARKRAKPCYRGAVSERNAVLAGTTSKEDSTQENGRAGGRLLPAWKRLSGAPRMWSAYAALAPTQTKDPCPL